MKVVNLPEQEVERSSIAKYDFPDAKGHFVMYGGSCVSQTLTLALEEL